MTTIITKFSAAAVVAGTLFLAPVAGSAQDTFSQSELQSFAVAALAVNDVIEVWRPRIESAETPEKASELAEQANAEMRAAVESSEGMTIETYQEIVEAAREDPTLVERIDGIIAEMEGN